MTPDSWSVASRRSRPYTYGYVYTISFALTKIFLNELDPQANQRI
jgi:hypothetical protein